LVIYFVELLSQCLYYELELATIKSSSQGFAWRAENNTITNWLLVFAFHMQSETTITTTAFGGCTGNPAIGARYWLKASGQDPERWQHPRSPCPLLQPPAN